ncbi:hypothetical protein AB8U03_14710 [Clostridium sp. Mt-5]|uniref:Uncharacterized protein n=1 Tax=Clostridium moutaii TaxID=3240932 RepID=A0ABV4BRP6_9CLOT
MKIRSRNTWVTDKNLLCTRKINGLSISPLDFTDFIIYNGVGKTI